MIATPWSPSVPETRITSPGRARLAPEFTPSGSTPTPVVVMKTPSPLPRSTTLVSPVTTGTPASFAARAMDSTMREVGQRKAFFEDEAGGKIQRLRAHHGDVVDRAMHRQAADVAAGEEQRRDHVAVGGHHQAPASRRRQHGAVVALAQVFVVEVLANSSSISCTMARPPEPWVDIHPCFRSSGRYVAAVSHVTHQCMSL
jgi:hypothetical protein